MSRKTEYVHNPCFLSANILKILGVFAENQIKKYYGVSPSKYGESEKTGSYPAINLKNEK